MINSILCPSPNWDERPEGVSIDTVVIHYTGMKSARAALDHMCSAQAKVSAHYMIAEDGNLYNLVDESKRAWHAGVSSWLGQDNINHNSVGIELVNPGHEFGYRPFPDVQICKLLELLNAIEKRHAIPKDRYLGHSDIAPDRKSDPGELFPWQHLAQSGFGLWSDKDGSSEKILLRKADKNALVADLNKQLGVIGYNIPDSLEYTSYTEWAVRAFQAHWRPKNISGCYDEGTSLILSDIILKKV